MNAASIDLMIVDDQSNVLNSITRIAQQTYHLSAVTFESGRAALAYLQQLPDDELPFAYLVDMRTDPTMKDAVELASPRALFDYLHLKGMTDHFYFMSFHVSVHDVQVQRETGGNPIARKLQVTTTGLFADLSPLSKIAAAKAAQQH